MLTAWNLYAATVCDPLEKYLTHSFDDSAWSIESVFDEWLSNGEFNDDVLVQGNLTHVGIACSCSNAGSICGFLFTHTYIGFDVEEPWPRPIDYADIDTYT